MDPLLASDIEIASTLTPFQKLEQAFELFAVGLRLKRAALATRHAGATAAELDAMLKAWLLADE